MINDLKEFEKFLKICRKQGVTEISYQGTSVKFGELPLKETSVQEEPDDISADALTPEQLMFYAVQG
jgi:hypothetical protein